jgi:hypothetical protein
MKTDDLISAIVEDDKASPRPSVAGRVSVALTFGGLVAAALFAIVLGIRPDIGSAIQTWRFLAKLAVVLACFASALWSTAQLARPDADHRKVIAVLAVAPALLALAVGSELMASTAATWPARAIGSNSPICLMAIPLLSAATLAALLVAMRAGAARSPRTAGAVAGLLSAALAASLYAVHCVDDSPLFVALWYTPAAAMVVLLGATVGSRALRW